VSPLQKHSSIAARQSTHTQWQQPNSTRIGLWRGIDTTFYKTVSHFINLNVQDCNLSWPPNYCHYLDLLWLIPTNQHRSTWLASWLPTLSCHCDDCSLISDQSPCDLTYCIINKLTCWLCCLRLFYIFNAGIS
jgi:hypothetical protein